MEAYNLRRDRRGQHSPHPRRRAVGHSIGAVPLHPLAVRVYEPERLRKHSAPADRLPRGSGWRGGVAAPRRGVKRRPRCGSRGGWTMQAKYADSQRLEQLIRRLAPLYGPSGREEAVRAAVIDLVKPLADEVTVDALGNVIARRSGEGGPEARRVMVAAHMDEIGVIVTHIDDNGFLRFAPVGGVGPATLLGQQVVFDNGVVGAVGIEKVEGPKDIHLDKLFIDIGASSKQEAEK